MTDNLLILTKQSGILKPFAIILGFILDKVFFVLDAIGIPNLGLAIIIFTIITYVLMLPLTYKQQKFSKFNAKMSPEIQAIQAKYKGRKDQDSMMRMQQETQLIYEKYGVSPSGSCLQLLIQMPILFALYRVIYSIPAYVGKVGNVFRVLSEKIVTSDHGSYLLNTGSSSVNSAIKSYGKAFSSAYETVSANGINFISSSANAISDNAATVSANLTTSPQFTELTNGVTDVLNRLSTSDLINVSQHYGLDQLKYNGDAILSTYDSVGRVADAGLIDKFNTFMGINISNSPSYTLKTEWGLGSDKSWWIIIVAIMIPLLAALTQWINTLLTPQPVQQNDGEQNSMAASFKVMNKVMPIMSAVMCFILPIGMGIYWIIGAVVRGIIQVILNKKIDKIDIEKMIEENIEKANVKRAKKGLPSYQMVANANKSTKNIKSYQPTVNNNSYKKKASDGDRETNIKESTDYYKKLNGAKEGSLASKVMMVKQYNERGKADSSKKNADNNKKDE